MFSADKLKENYSEADCEKIQQLAEKLKQTCTDENLFLVATEIAEIIINLKLDASCILSALAFPFVKNGNISIDDFGDDKELVSLLKKLIKCDELAQSYTDAEGLKEMLLAITKDIRVIIIKSAEVLVFARKNVKNTKNIQAINIFKAINDIYAPISARLGLSEIKSELQDLSFEFHEPAEFEKLTKLVKDETRANVHLINKAVAEIKKLLSQNGIECKCYGRVKHISSIYNKIKNKKVSLKNIYDISAVRILVQNISECYMALGIVHAHFVPVDGRFKDYVANPKPNGYQSLHTTVYYNGEFFEVQIRTFNMHEFAEYGVAAHFLYKEKKTKLNGVDNKLLWIRKMLENKENVSSEKILEELKTDVYLGEIFVQSPKGKVIKLVEGSTPIDFAYAIHSDIGNKCVGARVNGSMVPLVSSLSNGDVVEILTSQTSKGPSRDWLKCVKMQSTKDKINSFFKKQMKEENIKLGKAMLEQYAKSNDINLAELMVDKYLSVILKKNSFRSVDELYASIGYGSTTAEKTVHRIEGLRQNELKKNRVVFDDIKKAPLKIEQGTDVVGAEGSLTKYCGWCNPIPGDDIVGYVSRGRGIIIHKKSCENVKKLPESRFIALKWNDSDGDCMFNTVVEVVAKNSGNIYLEITNALSELSVRVVSLNSNENKNGELVMRIGVMVRNRDMLQKIKNKLTSLKSVFEVK